MLKEKENSELRIISVSGDVMFTDDEISLLMALQYNFPLSEETYIDIADFCGFNVDFVLKKTAEMLDSGVIKRIGAQLNYKAFKAIGYAALIGAKVQKDRIERVAEIINSYNPKHNYMRNDEYNIWFTIKAESPEALEKIAKEIMEKAGVTDFVFLPSKRVYKMDVKYDIKKGVSYSNTELEPEKIPSAEELGIEIELLKELERRFPVKNRPYKEICRKFGYQEGEIISLIEELIEKRVLRGFYAVLKERKIGFRENGMNMVETENPKSVALRLIKRFPEITHLVERETFGKWAYPLYFMVHAIDRDIIEGIRERVLDTRGIKSIKTIYSLRDFRPESRY
jgi:DNA-binding Lrp family transcriptional regulator